MVGCVLVKADRVVAAGFHRRFGGPHAEIEALRKAGEAARGCTAYVTLEPCCHHGKTGPCTDALIAAGVRRVLVAMRDPFVQVAGKGLRRLRRAGIEVAVGLCREEAQSLNAPYLKRLRTGMPWVILKWAQSLDGKLATATGQSRWITGEPARKEAHRIRGLVDAVIVGAATVLADDPMLTCRLARPRRIARRVVVDGRLRIRLDCALVQTAGQVPVVVATTESAVQSARRKAEALRRAGCEVLALRGREPGRIDLRALLEWLGSQQATNVMVEGGGNLLGQFLAERLADELAVFIAPMLVGGKGAVAPWPGGAGDLAEAPRLQAARFRRVGLDWYVRGRLQWP